MRHTKEHRNTNTNISLYNATGSTVLAGGSVILKCILKQARYEDDFIYTPQYKV